MTDYKELPYDQLKSLHKEIGAFLSEKKQEELEQLRTKMAALGFTPDDLAPKKPNGKAPVQAKYKNDETGETWSGRGHRPAWIKEAADAGRDIDEFLIRH